jgi:hypothetical protein
VNPGPILLCGVHTVVLCCDGDFNWLGQVWGGGDLTASSHHTASVSAIWTLVVYTSPLSLALSLLSMASIVPDEEVFSKFTGKSKQQYRRI